MGASEWRQQGYAHVNVWPLNDAGATWDDAAARAIASELERQPGFRSYTLVRTGEWEVVAVTVFETRTQLEAALSQVLPLVRAHVTPLAEAPPERREGAVLYQIMAA